MSVPFEENPIARQMQYSTITEAPKGISGKLIAWGIAKDEKSANITLLIVFVVLLIITILFLAQLGDNSVIVELTPEERFQLDRMGAQ